MLTEEAVLLPVLVLLWYEGASFPFDAYKTSVKQSYLHKKTRGAACRVLGVHANICRSVFESDVMGYVGERELLRSGGVSVVLFFFYEIKRDGISFTWQISWYLNAEWSSLWELKNKWKLFVLKQPPWSVFLFQSEMIWSCEFLCVHTPSLTHLHTHTHTY